MSVWLVIAAMAAAAAAILLLPLLRKGQGAQARLAYDLAVYRDQLAEIARDEARGVLPADEAASARLEIERRILAAGEGAQSTPSLTPSRAARISIIAIAIAGPLAATALYLEHGSPHMPGYPLASRGGEGTKSATGNVDMAKILKMVDKLAQRMDAEPNNLKGWTMLGRSYALLQRHDDAAKAFAHAAALDPKDSALPAGEGEAMVFASGGIVTPKARDAFEAALAIDPKEPRSRYYLGLASAQAGQPQAALAAWEALAAEAPPDTPWLPDLHRQIEKLQEQIESAAKAPDKGGDKPPADKPTRKPTGP